MRHLTLAQYGEAFNGALRDCFGKPWWRLLLAIILFGAAIVWADAGWFDAVKMLVAVAAILGLGLVLGAAIAAFER